MSRVLIVDDHEVLSDTLQLALEANGVTEVGTLSPAGVDLRAAIASIETPEVALVDLDLGDSSPDGTDLIPLLTARGVRTIAFTGCNDAPTLGRCLEAGAIGVIHKSQPFDVVVAKVLGALDGQAVSTEADKYQWLLAATREEHERERACEPFARLTPREGEVLASLMDGFHPEEIADRDSVSVVTVRSQLRSIFLKLGVTSQLAAVAEARRVRWRPPTSRSGPDDCRCC